MIFGRGFGSVTSSAAAFITPFFNASVKSSWLTIPPRAILTSVAIAFIRASSFADIMWLVSDVSGVHSTIKSD